MSEPKKDSTRLTKVEVAALVTLSEPVLDKETGKPTGKMRERKLKPAEVFSFAEYDTHVVVCTISGQKLKGDK